MEKQAAVQATLEGRKTGSGGESLASRHHVDLDVVLSRDHHHHYFNHDVHDNSTYDHRQGYEYEVSDTQSEQCPGQDDDIGQGHQQDLDDHYDHHHNSGSRVESSIFFFKESQLQVSFWLKYYYTKVDGPLDIPLGVPAEPAAGEPSTSKPGSKISLWVVPHGEEDTPTLSQVPRVSFSSQTDDKAGASVGLGPGQNRVPSKSKQSSSSPRPKALNPAAGESPDLDDTLAFLSPPSSQITADASVLSRKKNPKSPKVYENSHNHDAEDAALFKSLLGAPGSDGRGLTAQQQLQILQSALGNGANLNDPKTREKLASLLAALVVARTREGGGTGTPGGRALGATSLGANPTLSSPSPSPTAAADAALLSALLGAGGGHGLGGPFGGRPVSSTEQTLRDQLLITELLRAGQQQPPPSRPRSKTRTSTTTSTTAASGPVDAEAAADTNATTPTSVSSEAPVTKRQKKRPASSTPRPTDFRGLFAFQDSPRGATADAADTGAGEPGRDQPLVTAAINVTRAVSQFMGLVIQGIGRAFKPLVFGHSGPSGGAGGSGGASHSGSGLAALVNALGASSG
ncbi:Protein GLUTELIN PRECURSOR ACCUMULATION 3 [Frankliniella fusca]|uniref:Protein GLUTELIN ACCUMULATION 3 n=1 Tax=Frankliniella fusca TaxID=407009 RepID=A0AAE1HP24_9NEOP|nr:Protein GLUTELIN PRECURSOR ACCUMULATION 3 [Frankliniella fusca]